MENGKAEERFFTCGWCHRRTSWEEGCADELVDFCDLCACLFLPLYDFVDRKGHTCRAAVA